MYKNLNDIIVTLATTIDYEFMVLETSERECIDFAARLRQSIKLLTEAEKAFTKQATENTRFDDDTLQGKSARLRGVDFYAQVTETIRWSLDSKAVKVEMGDEWYNKRCTQGVVRSVKYIEGAHAK